MPGARCVFDRLRRTSRAEIGAPRQEIEDGPEIGTVAILGVDHPGLRPALKVDEEARVGAGDVLFTDRKRPEIAFVAPVSGTVTALQRGPRRSLSALVIRRDGAPGAAAAAPPDETEVRATLLARGCWPAFRTRPFGRIPAPDTVPEAIFVTATEADPLAPDPRVVLAERAEPFRHGVALLERLTDGPVHVCQTPGPDLVPASGRVRPATFRGAHPTGLAAHHVRRLHPVDAEHRVWTVGYQDVAAIGELFLTGRYPAERVIALAGPRLTRPRLVRTVLGASLRDLTAGEDLAGEPGTGVRMLSGAILSGREAGFLGRYHLQVSVIDAPRPSRLARLKLPGRALRPIIPVAALDRALPTDAPAVPLMRALSVGDAETAARLGVLDLLEEDVAMLTRLCTSGADYGALLRTVLNELEAA